MDLRIQNSINYRGFTLFELVFVMSTIFILFGLALPEFSHFLDKRKVSAVSMNLRGNLQLARKTAITKHQKVTVCPTSDGSSCSRDWSDGYLLFIDNNEDRNLDHSDTLIRYENIQYSEIQMRWRAFGIRDSLQWHNTGITNHQNGSFELCYKDDPRLSRALIISKAGRIRASKDNDGDQIHENSVGDPIVCG